MFTFWGTWHERDCPSQTYTTINSSCTCQQICLKRVIYFETTWWYAKVILYVTRPGKTNEFPLQNWWLKDIIFFDHGPFLGDMLIPEVFFGGWNFHQKPEWNKNPLPKELLVTDWKGYYPAPKLISYILRFYVWYRVWLCVVYLMSCILCCTFDIP